MKASPPFTHLLVPLDGSRLAEAALPVAFGLARGLNARLTLLHILEHDPPRTIHGEPHLTDVAAAERYMSGLAARYAHSGVAVDFHVHPTGERSVPDSVVGHAEELAVDLVVLTPHGRGDIRRLLIGSIPQVVLQRGNTPVVFVPDRPAGAAGPDAANEQPPLFDVHKLLVPLEGHDPEAVLRAARTLCDAFDASVLLAQVVPTLGTMRGEEAATALLTPAATRESLNLRESIALDYLNSTAEAWPADHRPRVQVLRGEPAQEILNLIHQTQPDLTLMSTHGRSGLQGIWAASVAARVVARSTCPLLLLRVS